MKKQTTETLKIVAGILVGTALVMGVMGFMLNMVLHPFMIMLALIVLFVVSIIVVGIFIGYKGIIVVIGSFVFGWFGFDAYYKHACGSNSADVKVMQPMAEKISDYIVKHGIPESLEDIPDLPYGLEGCKREVEYSKFNKNELITEKVDSKEKADFYNINEDCNFSYHNRVYYIKLDEGVSKNIKDGARGNINIGNKESHTWASLGFNLNSMGEVIMTNDFNFGSSKDTGICKSWRQ